MGTNSNEVPSSSVASRYRQRAIRCSRNLGLGFLFVETVSQSLGARTLNWFLSTPVDGDNVSLLVSAKVQALDSTGVRALAMVPKQLREKIMVLLVMYEFKKNIERDFVVWENKAYKERPLLNKADGDIMKFGRYCNQIYLDAVS